MGVIDWLLVALIGGWILWIVIPGKGKKTGCCGNCSGCGGCGCSECSHNNI